MSCRYLVDAVINFNTQCRITLWSCCQSAGCNRCRLTPRLFPLFGLLRPCDLLVTSPGAVIRQVSRHSFARLVGYFVVGANWQVKQRLRGAVSIYSSQDAVIRIAPGCREDCRNRSFGTAVEQWMVQTRVLLMLLPCTHTELA